jgi:hypothetical protein
MTPMATLALQKRNKSTAAPRKIVCLFNMMPVCMFYCGPHQSRTNYSFCEDLSVLKVLNRTVETKSLYDFVLWSRLNWDCCSTAALLSWMRYAVTWKKEVSAIGILAAIADTPLARHLDSKSFSGSQSKLIIVEGYEKLCCRFHCCGHMPKIE